MKKTIFLLLACMFLLTIYACAKKGAGTGVDVTTPLDQLKAAAEKMDVSQLRAKAVSYKDAIVARQPELTKISDQVKAINPAEMLSEKATQLKSQLAEVEKSISDLKERFNIYYEQLKAKAGDLTGLELP